mmetsp:Transcript_47670/g.102050  ORF Transcript_47670/g.102050 Transcript_47670/m.102050 type:complete len:229 (-) Transcript_47670:310-996(-)
MVVTSGKFWDSDAKSKAKLCSEAAKALSSQCPCIILLFSDVRGSRITCTMFKACPLSLYASVVLVIFKKKRDWSSAADPRHPKLSKIGSLPPARTHVFPSGWEMWNTLVFEENEHLAYVRKSSSRMVKAALSGLGSVKNQANIDLTNVVPEDSGPATRIVSCCLMGSFVISICTGGAFSGINLSRRFRTSSFCSCRHIIFGSSRSSERAESMCLNCFRQSESQNDRLR